MSTRFIVIAAQAEAASQVSDDFAALVPASTLARVSAAPPTPSKPSPALWKISAAAQKMLS